MARNLKIVGWVLALIYFVFSFAEWIDYITCTPMLCSLPILFYTLPWSLIYDIGRYGFGPTISLGYIILNTIIIYYAIYWLGRYFSYRKK